MKEMTIEWTTWHGRKPHEPEMRKLYGRRVMETPPGLLEPMRGLNNGSSIRPDWPGIGHRGRLFKPKSKTESTGFKDIAHKLR
jgi:hypothetical protein